MATARPKTTMTEAVSYDKAITDPELHFLILKKTKSYYRKASNFVAKNLGLVILAALCLGAMIAAITICLCRYEAIISTQ